MAEPAAPPRRGRACPASDHGFLRTVARRTWRFFETFVGPDDNHLPPDNFQEDPPDGVAHRTSPTNIGLALLANLAAYDFGYITAGEVIGRTARTLGASTGCSGTAATCSTGTTRGRWSRCGRCTSRPSTAETSPATCSRSPPG